MAYLNLINKIQIEKKAQEEAIARDIARDMQEVKQKLVKLVVIKLDTTVILWMVLVYYGSTGGSIRWV